MLLFVFVSGTKKKYTYIYYYVLDQLRQTRGQLEDNCGCAISNIWVKTRGQLADVLTKGEIAERARAGSATKNSQ